jgi:hypothetical protein
MLSPSWRGPLSRAHLSPQAVLAALTSIPAIALLFNGVFNFEAKTRWYAKTLEGRLFWFSDQIDTGIPKRFAPFLRIRG